MTYEEIIEKIKSLEIQGAQNIAVKGIEAFGLKMKETSDKTLLQKYADEIIATRSTEPGMRNGINFCLANVGTIENPAEEAIKHFQESNKIIAEIGSKKIKDGMIVFTHCHSSTVEAILVKAHEEGKKFEVYNTETRPKFQGRITATNLAKAGIKVTHMVDSAGRSMIKKADLFLFGCDAITSEGFLINKIGTESLVDAANEAGIPAYSCTDSWKFDTVTIGGVEDPIELRDPNEVWENPPVNVSIYNPAFEVTRPDKFTGIITEIGVYKAETLVLEFQKHYPWLLPKKI
jgi:ribose 1,5-bisphosphate isomerase